MERSKSIISIVVGLAAILIIWRVGFYPPAPEQTEKQVVTEVAADPNLPGDVNEPMVTFNVDESRGRRPAGDDEPVRMFAESEPNEPTDPNGPMEFVNLKSVEMKSIIEKLASWTGKVIIPTDEALKQKVTIYAPEKLPRSEALRVIYSALRMKGYIVEESDGTIFLKPIADAKLGRVPIIPAGEPLAMIENKDQVVQKFFELLSYSPSEMGSILQPLIGEYGYMSVDETGGTLMVIDTVSNLMRLERIIQQFDVPGSEQAVTDIIEVRYGDPSEIVQMLNILLGEMEGRSTLQYNRNRDRANRGSSRQNSSRNSSERISSSAAKKTDSSQGSATSVVVGTTRGPVVLIPEPRRKWIIAKASAEDLKQIREWVNKLDMEEPVGSEYEVVQLRYADPQEVEQSIGDGFQDLPGTEFLPSILVQPLTQTKQVIIFGRKDLREIVKKMIAEIDVPPGQFETAHIKLKHADPDMIKEKLDELYQDGMSGSSNRNFFGGYNSYSRGRGGSSSQSSEMVKVVSYTTLKEITVIASPENMVEIRKRLAEWDVPLDIDSLKPRIIELRNCDPVEMANLLTSLFSEGGSSSSSRGVAMFRGMFATQLVDQQKIVGALYGQLAFEEVPGTKKIIVISKIPEAYNVIEDLVKELDKAEMAEIPKVIELKYSDPEVLCEILNAMFAEAGTSASLRRSDVGLSEYSMDETQTTTAESTSQSQYTPPWSSSGARRTVDEEMPISNVIGRIRFVPEPRTKSILVLSPPEFMPQIEKLIEELDVPGKQVMIKAIIVEVDHSNMTSLGMQLAPTGSEMTAFGSYDEDTVAVLNELRYLQERGSLTLTAAADVTAMVDFLATQTNAKILNQQTLWTEDNEEASFFKGDKVAFLTSATTSATAGNVQNTEFQRVGMTLAVRPSITPNKDVDMIINIIISQMAPGDMENGQPVRTEMETKTNMIVGNGQTIMLGGILFQEDRIVKRKVPLLGDIPLIGELLFGHTESIAANNEMLVFITPYVIDDFENLTPETREQIEQPKEKLKNIREQLDTSIKRLK